MRRYDCLLALRDRIGDDLVTTNMGGTANEWFAVRPSDRNFLMWHSLGLCSSIALGMALGLPHRRVWSLDGDGGLLMNLGGLCTVALMAPPNLFIVGFDNRGYEATGGMPSATVGPSDLAQVARGAGIARVWQADTLPGFEKAVGEAIEGAGPVFIHARVEMGTAAVPFPDEDAMETKFKFIRMVERTEGRRIVTLPPYGVRPQPRRY
jgi:thiamine pyrophosphate-dependent acetolactate synthase large subunit-like protein